VKPNRRPSFFERHDYLSLPLMLLLLLVVALLANTLFW
jgi:hypothetical protein